LVQPPPQTSQNEKEAEVSAHLFPIFMALPLKLTLIGIPLTIFSSFLKYKEALKEIVSD
jgi:hypothetical protein